MAQKLGRMLGLGGALAVVGGLGLAWMEFDSPELGRALLARAGAALGARLEAAEFRLSLLRGLSLRDVRASGTFPGGRYELALERLVYQHRLLPLLRGRLAVDRIRIVRPMVRLSEARGARSSPALPPASVPAIPLQLHVSQITVEDGTIEMHAAGESPVVVRGLRVRLADVATDAGPGSALERLSGRGEFRIEEVALPRTRVRSASGTLRLAKGRLATDDLRFQTEEGPFTASWSADVRHLPFSYTLSVEGAPLDLNAALGPASGRGRLGPARLQLQGGGVGPEARGLTGTGLLRLDEGTLPGSPVLTGLERALGRTRLVGASYRASETPFRIEGGRVSFQGLRLDTDGVGLDVGGWTSLEGPFELKVAIRAPRSQVHIAEVPAAALDALTDIDGDVRIPFRVTGTREAPRIVPDAAALLAQARQGGLRALTGQARDRLQELFRKPE